MDEAAEGFAKRPVRPRVWSRRPQSAAVAPPAALGSLIAAAGTAATAGNVTPSQEPPPLRDPAEPASQSGAVRPRWGASRRRRAAGLRCGLRRRRTRQHHVGPAGKLVASTASTAMDRE
jgi:hypothetical protein